MIKYYKLLDVLNRRSMTKKNYVSELAIEHVPGHEPATEQEDT